MSERIHDHGTGAEVYSLEEIAAGQGGNEDSVTHTEQDLRDYRHEVKAADSQELAGPAPSSDDQENEPSRGSSTRRGSRGRSSRTGHNQKRAQKDSRNATTKIPEADTYEPTEHEEWAREYVQENLNLFSEDYPALMSARERLAEASVKMRRGTLTFSSTRAKNEFEAALNAYKEVRSDFVEQRLDELEEPLARKRAFAAALEASEDGALMGEEVNYYLQKENSRLHNSWEKTKTWYKERGRGTRIALGVGATTVAGALGGLTAAGAAAGALGARAGKIFLGRESSRSDDAKDLRQKQEEATLRASGVGDYRDNYQSLRNLKSKGRKIQAINLVETGQKRLDGFLAAEEHTGDEPEVVSAYDQAAIEADNEARDKRQSAAWALGGAAVGAGAGWLIERAGDLGDVGLFRGGEAPDAPTVEDAPDTPDTGDELDAEIEAEIDGQITELEQEVEELEKQIDSNAEKVEELEARNETATGDISTELGLPEGYISKTATGYEVTAIPGGETDSIWRAAEHSLHDHLGREPSTDEINSLQNILGGHWLNAGEKVVISQDQITRALSST